ncbi:MAG TPA: NAD-dependent epimerase/dehydratase family protein [Solirubrobacteraceae bacterium]|nr:NAD-dependent epimerase/dehydratase family protein [Solirubrobacteraceae bacterium]
MTRAFVTGALGFIGAALAARLRAEGVEVRGVDMRADPQLGVVAGDVSSVGEWQDHARGCDVVFHTAAIVSLRSGLEDFHRVNVLGTRNALDAAIEGGASRFVQLSSVTVFGNDFPDGVEEEHPVRLLGVPYVDTKIAGEQVVLQAHAAGRMAVTVVRPGDVYGPGSRPWILAPLQELKRGRLVLPMGGRGIHSPVHVDDLIDGIAAVVGADAAAGEVITLSGGVGVSTGEYFGHIAAMIGRSRVRSAPTSVLVALAGAQAAVERVRGTPGEINPNAVRYLTRTGTYSIAKARRLLAFEPKVALEDGMRGCEAWLRAEGIVGRG